MISLPKDVLINDLLTKMPALDLIKFCQTNRNYLSFCRDPNFWKYRLQTNFGVLNRFDNISDINLDIALSSHHARIVPINYNNRLLTYILIYPDDTKEIVFNKIYKFYKNLRGDTHVLVPFILIESLYNDHNIVNLYPYDITPNTAIILHQIDVKIYQQLIGDIDSFNIIDELDLMEDILNDTYHLSIGYHRRTPRNVMLLPLNLIIYGLAGNLDYDTTGNFIDKTYNNFVII